MDNTAPEARFQWDPEKGKLVVTIAACSVTFPTAMLPALAMQARRVLAAHQATKSRSEAKGGWMAVHPLPIETARVDTMQIQTGHVCLLMLDPGTDVEIQFYF